MIRDAARIVSEKQNLCVIDTSNEIDVPHSSLGRAIRMIVPCLEMQAEAMIECVQNHTVECMVIDEIGKSQEVAAAQTVKERGVRIIGTAHGTLSSLLKNPMLNGLAGGRKTVTIGDASVPRGRKTISERQGQPVFDVMIELSPKAPGDGDLVCKIFPNVARAMDSSLDGKKVEFEQRRLTSSGQLLVDFGEYFA